jgi:hypothetical protein
MLTYADVCLYFSYCEAGFEQQFIHNYQIVWVKVCTLLSLLVQKYKNCQNFTHNYQIVWVKVCTLLLSMHFTFFTSAKVQKLTKLHKYKH